MNHTHRITFTEASLTYALSAVRGLHDLSTELIATDMFRQITTLVGNTVMPTTVWCGQSGLYENRLDAAVNGEQQVAPAVVVSAPHYDIATAIGAEHAMDAAKQQLSQAIQRAYPTGTRVRADLGQHQAIIEVTGYGSWWANPEYINGKNVKTGKERKFHHRYVVEVLP
ncbi:TPA: hypothetical protein QEM47_000911 [Pseudomonas putida]|uniref:hypothetical protein n=1 Tax=Pseudomonas putida TaxID=303 RepID=UPI000B05EF1C|nr:hypothetical protein [Pseudomonas putida]MDD2117828.1 hypothetical protein [Pseudomonas putida]UPU94876.1 hypothetical protein M0766_11320 [Pseudomonas putida]HDS1728188.1 hypothetical protein [Pseudomonas putida]